MLIAYALGYLAILIAFAIVIRRSVWLSFALALGALATAPLWADNLDGWFRWLKTLSVLIPMAFLIGLARIAHHDDRGGPWRIMRGDWVLWAFYAMFGLNIIEASVKDIALGNTFNGAAGFILAILLPAVMYPGTSQRNWGFASDNRGDVFCMSGLAWNIAYVSWNLAFVYNENPSYFISSAVLLSAALLYTTAIGKPELFGMIRVFTLAFHLTLRAATDWLPQTLDDADAVTDPQIGLIWGAVNLMGLMALLVYRVSTESGRMRSSAA